MRHAHRAQRCPASARRQTCLLCFHHAGGIGSRRVSLRPAQKAIKATDALPSLSLPLSGFPVTMEGGNSTASPSTRPPSPHPATRVVRQEPLPTLESTGRRPGGPCVQSRPAGVEGGGDQSGGGGEGKVLQISGERSAQKEQKNEKWHRVARSSGKFVRRFRLPENAKVEEVKAWMDSGVLTVTVPKVEAKKSEIKAIEISG